MTSQVLSRGAVPASGGSTRDRHLTALIGRLSWLVPLLLLVLLLQALLLQPASGQSPQISIEAGADVLSLDRAAIESAEIPEGYPAVISGKQDLVPLLIRFVPRVGNALEALTARHIGETISIRIDGALVSQPVIREAVTTGGIIITNIDRRVAEAVIAAARARAGQ